MFHIVSTASWSATIFPGTLKLILLKTFVFVCWSKFCHWFRLWPGTEQKTSHYRKHWWSSCTHAYMHCIQCVKHLHIWWWANIGGMFVWAVLNLWPSDVIRWHRSGSTLAQVMACCLMAPSHYLDQCWLVINMVLWILPRAISQDMLNISVLDINLNISHLRLQPHLTGANKLVPSLCDSYSLIHSNMIPQSLGHGGCYEGARKCYSTHYIPIVVKVKFMASGVINEKYTLILFVYCILLMFWRFLTLSFPCVFITYKAMFDVCVIPVISSI